LVNAVIFIALFLFVLAAALSVYLYAVSPERVVTKTIVQQAPAPVPTTVTVSSPTDKAKIIELQNINAQLQAENASLKLGLVPPAAIIWPTTALTITSDEARALLTRTFPNRRITGAHFTTASLYTLEQFKEIRSKMSQLENNLSWPSLVDKAIGEFQQPGLENIPVGWAYPSQASMYLIVVLQDAGQTKIFGFDPIDKAKIWEVSTDTRVEAAIIR
jgi:hypothetical protein